ncbi:MAG TPA: sigma-70 family RNA polymerase sigma factor [Candidatus Acetothermia bacterium]|nr:sigma-70 family RNA polymerase sigma factor [Candidatus Acetothermia bacterium]
MPETERERFANLSNERLIELLRHVSEKNGDSAYVSHVREEIIERNVGLVRSIAASFLNSGELLEDLVQAGYIGLLNAVTNFDLARNIRFSTYASYLIKGEIRHYIRDKHSTIRIPQWVQAMGQKLKEVEEAFFQENGKPPRIGEIASRMDLTEEQVVELLRGRKAMSYVSIDEERRSQDPHPPAPSITSMYKGAARPPSDIHMRIAITIDKLAQMQQQVIRGLFYQGKTQAQIGKELDMSQRQVSRMKEQALREVKGKVLGDDDG